MKTWPRASLVVGSLLLAGCGTGDFCSLYTPVYYKDLATSRAVVALDRAAAEATAANNSIAQTCK